MVPRPERDPDFVPSYIAAVLAINKWMSRAYTYMNNVKRVDLS